MLRLYGAARSRAVRTLWMLGELGLNYDHKDYRPRAPETRTPEFRALNPNGRVPVIDDDGFVLSESMAINLYLSKKYESSLYPSDPRNEALAWQWSLWETDRLDRQIVNYVRHTTEFPEAKSKKEIAEAAWQQVTECSRCWRRRSRKRSGLPALHFQSAISTSPQRFTVRWRSIPKNGHTRRPGSTAAGSARQRSGRAPCAKANRTGVRGFYISRLWKDRR